ncbi:MAG: Fur family transcriptional regulator [Bacillota bacterium]
MDNLREKFKNKLSAHNYKLTDQRKDILDVFLDNIHHHFNAEELYEEVKKVNPDVGLATIYRNLELFCELDILHQLDFESSYKRYEINIEEKHHHHLICLECGQIMEFNDQVLEKFEEDLEKSHNFEIVDHRIKFYGYCEECSE